MQHIKWLAGVFHVGDIETNIPFPFFSKGSSTSGVSYITVHVISRPLRDLEVVLIKLYRPEEGILETMNEETEIQ